MLSGLFKPKNFLPPSMLNEKASTERIMSKGERDEYVSCMPDPSGLGFIRWCDRHVIIQDKDDQSEHEFHLWPGQRRVVADLASGIWLTILKGRQLGITWLMAAWVMYCVIYWKYCTAPIINQERGYAEDFIERIRWIYDRLPWWAQPKIVKDNEKLLRFKSGSSNAEVRAMVGGRKAIRSITGDLLIIDEGAYVANFGPSLAAAIPAYRRATGGKHGQIIVATTSSGPETEYAVHWDASYGAGGDALDADGVGRNHFKPIFLHWSERPGRDQAWYEDRKVELDSVSPTEIKKELPNNPEEAFEYAEGRVYAKFSRHRNVGSLEIPDDAVRYRAVDWGESKSAYVVLWIAFMKGPAGLLIDPSCPNSIREMLGYRLDPNGRPEKANDHAPDALRYCVTTFNLRGLVYVYREVWRLDSVARGWSPTKDIAEIHELSGWTRSGASYKRPWRMTPKAEKFRGTVADRAMGKLINEFSGNQIPTQGHAWFERRDQKRKLRDKPFDERIEGVRWVADLIDGTEDLHHFYQITPEEKALLIHDRIRRRRVAGKRTASGPLEETKELILARELLAKVRRR